MGTVGDDGDDDDYIDVEDEKPKREQSKGKGKNKGKSRAVADLTFLPGGSSSADVNPKVMLISLKAGALGLNLTVANNVYL